MRERLGFYQFKSSKSIWVHAVSMGETLAAVPLVKALQQAYPDFPIVITTMTPTGAAQAVKSFGDSVKHLYLPYDYPDAIQRFLRAVNPVIGIIMETELWPNLLNACAKRNIPVCLLNARLSEKSARGYQLVQPLMHHMLKNLAAIAAHSEADAKRFLQLGAERSRVMVAGNIKFDINLPHDLSEKVIKLKEMIGQRFVWIAASTHAGEEEKILAAHQLILRHDPHALLLLVPRHPDRFNDVAALIHAHRFHYKRRSSYEEINADTQIYLCDSMGELLMFYAASDVAFVGGSLLPVGGHNMLEPAILNKPVISGKHTFNFAEVSELLINANALLIIEDEKSLAQEILNLMKQPNLCNEMGRRARKMVEQNRGALSRQFAIVQALLRDS